MPLPSSVAESSASSTMVVSWSPPPPRSPLTSSWKTGQRRYRGFTAPHWGSPNLKRAPPPQTQRRRPNKAIQANNRPLPFSASSQTHYRTICSQGLSSSNIWLHIWRMNSVLRRSPVLGCLLRDTTWGAGAHRLRQIRTATRHPRCLRRKRRRRAAAHAAWSWSRRCCLCSRRTRSSAASWRISQVQ